MKYIFIKTKPFSDFFGAHRFFLICILFPVCMPIHFSHADQFDIVINEIMYHTAETNPCSEFLEIYNKGTTPVDLSGWYLQDEQQVMYTLPTNTILSAGGYLVFYKENNAVSCYGLNPSFSFGPYDGKLNNAGEHIILRNAANLIIDQVNYSDTVPWPTEPDGAGPSLELISPVADNSNPANWGLGQLYSPGTANNPSQPGGGDIVIAEIMYKPLKERYMHTLNSNWASNPYSWKDGDDPAGEFIELYNRGWQPIDLTNWKVTDEQGLLYQFTSSAILNPDSYLVICSDAAAISARYGISNTYGNFTTAGDRLSNGGERITLLNSNGLVIDSVNYNDKPPWPLAPDQLGSSLECLDSYSDNGRPENWRAFSLEEPAPQATHQWQYLEVTGNATSQRIYFYINGIGQWLVDQITVTPAGGGPNLISNGSFEPNDSGWFKSGNHTETHRTTSDYYDGTGSEYLVSSGIGGSLVNSLYREDLTGLTVGQNYTISCWLKYLIGHETLTFRLSGSTSTNGIFKTATADGLGGAYPPNPVVGDEIYYNRGTPGQANSASSTGLPPFINVEEIANLPIKPTSTDPVIITAEVSSDVTITNVSLHYEVFVAPYQSLIVTNDIDMFDNGLSGDGVAGDGKYGAILPPLSSQTLVRYRITATDDTARTWTYPDEYEPNPNRAYFVYDGEINSQAETYFLIAPQENLDFLLANIWSHEYVDCALVAEGIVYDNVGVHLRGQGWRHQPKKGWKISFNKAEYLRDMKKLDLAMHRPVQQKVVHDLFFSVGHGNLTSEVVRLHINGSFYGVFLAQESLNASSLRRRGLDDKGDVFHPDASHTDLNYYPDPDLYPQIYEKKSDPFGSFQSLMDLSYLITYTSPSEILGAMLNTVELDEWFYRWAINNCGPNFDISKNNFLLINPAEPNLKWQWISYDFSHYFGDYEGVSLDPYFFPNKWMDWSIDNGVFYSPEYENRHLVILNDIVQNYNIVQKLQTAMDEAYEKYQTDLNEELALGYGDWGPFVMDYNRKEGSKSMFTARNAWLKDWLAGKTFTPPANSHPLIQLDVPIISNNYIDITWDYSDTESDTCTVDLYWTDLLWTYITPIPGAQNLPAENKHFTWSIDLPENYAGRNIYIQAAISDNNSFLIHHDTSRLALTMENCEDIWENDRGLSGDINHDCYVDINDIFLLAGSWLSCSNPYDSDCMVLP